MLNKIKVGHDPGHELERTFPTTPTLIYELRTRKSVECMLSEVGCNPEFLFVFIVPSNAFSSDKKKKKVMHFLWLHHTHSLSL